jgi:peptidoglycan/LPS O-acetylase OafA/YrhL
MLDEQEKQHVQQEKLKYRADLDSIRAFSVLGVLLYHLSPQVFTGGFLAVDYFFVLSGFLMSSVIGIEIKNERFQIWHFFERRIKRLLPVLIVVMLFCVVLGYFILTPRAYQDLGRCILSISLYSSNFYFWLKSGYFDQASELKPLLHTWSLSLEEQFYLCFPFFMIWISKYPLKRKLNITLILTLFSFFICVFGTQIDPNFSFYLLFGRIWELTLGALLAFSLESQTFKNKVNDLSQNTIDLIWLMSISALTIVFLKYPTHFIFPSYYPLIPCLLVCCLILVGQRISFQIWTNPYWVGLGKISYSVYLWHWPLISFMHSLLMRDLTFIEKSFLFLISLGLGKISYQLIERPIQQSKSIKSSLVILAMLLMGLIGFILHLTQGLDFRFQEELKQIFQTQNQSVQFRQPCYYHQPSQIEKGEICQLGIVAPQSKLISVSNDLYQSKVFSNFTQIIQSHFRPSLKAEGTSNTLNAEYLLWGDSHADSARFALDLSLKKHLKKGIVLSKSSCPTLLDVWFDGMFEEGKKCQKFLESMLSYLSTHDSPKSIFLISRWSLYSIGSRVGHEAGKTIYVLDQDTEKLPLSTQHNLQVMYYSLSKLLERLIQLNKKVYLFYPSPEFSIDVPQYLGMRMIHPMFFSAQNQSLPISEHQYRQRRIKRLFEQLKQKFPQIEIIETQSLFCNQSNCPIASDSLEPYYYDQHHLSVNGSMLFLPLFDQIIQE